MIMQTRRHQMLHDHQRTARCCSWHGNRVPAPSIDDMQWLNADAWRSKRAEFLSYSWQKHDFSLAIFLRATQATYLSSPLIFGLPPALTSRWRDDASKLWLEWYLETFYEGQEERMQKDNEYYADGFFLLSRDLQRNKSALISLDEKDREASGPLRRDIGSLLSFSFIAMNTFPFTGLVVEAMLKNMPKWVPRRLIVPSHFEQEKLERYRRAKKIVASRRS